MKQGKSKHEMGGAMRYLKPILLGTAAGAVVIAFVLMLLSLLLSLQNIPQMLIMPMVLLALAIGSFAGGWVSAKAVHEKGMILGLCCGALLFIVLLLIGQGIEENSVGILAAIKLVVSLMCGAFGGVFGVNYKKRRK